ncbi:MAG: hypothetical protein Q9216_000504 [Gyalolechia sp. 2 TL-2023]
MFIDSAFYFPAKYFQFFQALSKHGAMAPTAIDDTTISGSLKDYTEIASLRKALTSESAPLARRFRALFSLKHYASLQPSTEQSLPAIQAIAAAFPSPSALLKHELAYCLGQTRNLASVPYLRQVLEDKHEDPMCRHEAAEALGALGDEKSLQILRQMRDDGSEAPVVRETCDIAVGRIEWEHSGQKKGERLRDSDFASIDPAPPLPQTAHRYSIGELREILLDVNLPLFQRYRAMFALRDLSSPPDLPTAVPAIQALASGFNDPSALFRHEIAFVFGQLSHPASIPSLISTLSDQKEESMVRHEAAEALGSLGDEDGVEEILRGFLDDPEQVVRESVVVALDMASFQKNGEKEYAVLVDEQDFSPFARAKIAIFSPEAPSSKFPQSVQKTSDPIAAILIVYLESPLNQILKPGMAGRELLQAELINIARTQGKSVLAQHALNTVKGYLDQNNTTDFNFKQPQSLGSSEPNGHVIRQRDEQTGNSHLGLFSSMLFNSTQLDNRYPTPTSPKSSYQTHDATEKAPRLERSSLPAQANQKLITPAPSELALFNQAALQKNAQIMSDDDSPAMNLKDSDQVPVVLIPPLSAESRPSEYVMFKDDQKPSPQKKIQLGEPSRVDSSTLTRDQRALADLASNNLHALIETIFEADELASMDTPYSSSTELALHFMYTEQDDGRVRTIAPATLVKLDTSLQSVIGAGRMGDVSVNDASRLQNLCEKTLAVVQSSDLSIDTTWNSDDFSIWIQRVASAETALRSARIVVRIMIGFRDEKTICSEETLQNVIDVLNRVLTSCIIPIIEIRPKDSESELFDLASVYRKEIGQLLYQANKVMRILADILNKVDIAEAIVTALEFLAIRVLFVENAQNEKDSVIGTQKFEGLRRTAMDIISGIFSKYPEQRAFIFDEILTSLQKLPTKGLKARQFKLSDGTSIQLVSALIMRLVQTSAAPAKNPVDTANTSASKARHQRKPRAESSDTEQEVSSETTNGHETLEGTSDGAGEEYVESASQRLAKEVNALNDHAAKDAQYVVRYFVQRAMTASKSGDQPYRHLLDMLTDDLIMVLGNPEWPAAEMLLRALMLSMMSITDNKSTAPAKNMALELLGTMGSAISELVANTQSCTRSLESHESCSSGHLRQLFDDYLDGSLDSAELTSWDGPYRMVMEYLKSVDSEGLPTLNAQLYYLTQWARGVTLPGPSADSKRTFLVCQLRKMVRDRVWDPSDTVDPVTKSQCRLAYALTVLNMNFCRQFDSIFKILLDSITSEQTTVRTRSLKSVTQMLEKDPSLLDRARNVKGLLIQCTADASPMVRDSTLMLIGKCIQQKPVLEQDFFKPIVSLANDPTVSVKKRSMKLLKDLFTHNKRKEVKKIIGECLLQRTDDLDKATSELAVQILEELWFSPFWKFVGAADDTPIQTRIALREQMDLIIDLTQGSDRVCSAMVSSLQILLNTNSKTAESNFKVCQKLVSTAFESIIDSEARTTGIEQKHIVQTLTVFAKASRRLFSAEQLQYLRPYISSVSNPDDFSLLRSAVIIFRCVLPTVPTVQHSLLLEVQKALLSIVSKLGKMELNEVAACLWTVNSVLKNPERLVRLVVSVIKGLQNLQSKDLSDPNGKEDLRRARRYINIAGAFGKQCDFEDQVTEFRTTFPSWKGMSVSGMIVDSIGSFASHTQPLPLRIDALNGIGQICQSSPLLFNQVKISDIFQQALVERNPDLQNIVLSNFRDFFATQETQASGKIELNQADGTAVAKTNGQLGASMKASESDGASALIAQRFLHNILSIALASQDVSALTATEVIASINRQGLVHPKESGPALVALETSTNPAIADVAFHAHSDLHLQHESMFEREYMRAIAEAYRYQRDIVQEPLGFRSSPFRSKLHPMFEIIKNSKGKYQKKFISNYCSKIDFDVEKLDLAGDVPVSLQFSRFLIENLAFFDYGRVDELLHTIGCMERIVTDVGSGIAHSINTEVFQVRVDTILEDAAASGTGTEQTMSHQAVVTPEVAPFRLRQLTTASIILSCLWEARTFLRRLYGLNSNQQRRESKGNGKSRDVNKAPTKSSGVTGEKMVAAIAARVASLKDQESMLKQCQEFVDLLSIDHEFKVVAEGEDEGAIRPWTPSGDEAEHPMPNSGGSRGPVKRKRLSSAASTPHKKRGRPTLGRRKSSRKSMNENEDEDEEWE